jgi:hypothetical protein
MYFVRRLELLVTRKHNVSETGFVSVFRVTFPGCISEVAVTLG